MLRVGMIGCGLLGHRHLRGYKSLFDAGLIPSSTLAAVCDTDVQALSTFSDKHRSLFDCPLTTYTSVSDMLSSECLDAIDICLPHGLHHSVSIQCLESSLHVLVQKPFGVTIRASRAILEASDRLGYQACVADNVRRMIGPRAVSWAFSELGILGEPRIFSINSAFCPTVRAEPLWSWRLDKRVSGGGLLMDGGVHMMDVLRYCFGEIDTVYANISSDESTWFSILHFRCGLTGTWNWTISAPCANIFNMDFYGSQGMVCYTGTASYPSTFKDAFHPFMIKDRGSVKTLDGSHYSLSDLCDMYISSLSPSEHNYLFPGHIYENGYALEIYDFLESILGNRSPETDGYEGLKSKAICIALYESAFSGEPVSVKDVLDGTINDYQRSIDSYWGL